jgi:hypothetical protein
MRLPADYPYRRHKVNHGFVMCDCSNELTVLQAIRLKGVPTFGRWVQGRLEMALDEHANDAEAIQDVMTAKL